MFTTGKYLYFDLETFSLTRFNYKNNFYLFLHLHYQNFEIEDQIFVISSLNVKHFFF